MLHISRLKSKLKTFHKEAAFFHGSCSFVSYWYIKQTPRFQGSPLSVWKGFHKKSPCRVGHLKPPRAARTRREHSNSTTVVNTWQRNAAQTKSYLLWRPTAAGSWRNIEREKPFLRLGRGKKFLFSNKSHGRKILSKIPSGSSVTITNQSSKHTCMQLLRLEFHTEFD